MHDNLSSGMHWFPSKHKNWKLIGFRFNAIWQTFVACYMKHGWLQFVKATSAGKSDDLLHCMIWIELKDT